MLKTFALTTGKKNEFVQQGSTPQNLILGKKDTALLFTTWDEANAFMDKKTYPINDFYIERVYPRTLIIGRAMHDKRVNRYGSWEHIWIINSIDGKIYYIATRSPIIENSIIENNGATIVCFTAGLVKQEGPIYKVAYPKPVENYEQLIQVAMR